MDPTHARRTGLDAGSDVPDPDFWGPEPRSVRRSPRTAPPRIARERTLVAFFDSLRERLHDTRIEFGAGIAAIVVVALVAGLVWYRMSAGGAAPPVRSEESSGVGTAFTATPIQSLRPSRLAPRCHGDGARRRSGEDPRCARALRWRPSHRRRRGCGRRADRRRPRPLEPCREADRRPASAGEQGRGTGNRDRTRRVRATEAPRR